MRPILKLSAAIILFAQFAFSQAADTPKPTEDKGKLEKEAVAFLRETLVDVNSMRSLENRISFSSEMAGLMWYHDANEARVMFNGVIRDFRELLARYDEQMVAFPADADGNGDRPYTGGLLGTELTERSKVVRKFSAAIAVRRQITTAMAEHDPDLAFAFYADTTAAVGNPALRKQMENGDSYFEHQLLTEIAQKNPGKAARYAAKSLEKGVNYQHIELLKKIYEKDADKGAEFAGAIRDRLKKDKIGSKDFWAVDSLLDFAAGTLEGSRSAGGKRPALSRDELRDLADAFAQGILSLDIEQHPEVGQYLEIIGKFAPGRVAEIRAKFRTTPPRGYAGNAVNAYTVRGVVTTSANTAYNGDSVPVVSGTGNDTDSAREARAGAEEKLYDDILGLSAKKPPREDRDKIVARARKILLETPGRDKKITGLSVLAGQVAQMGDKELAAEIMKDAASFVNPSPKNYQDFLLTWMLASGYAAVDPDKSFAILDDTIGRANETISAFVKVGEFIDVSEEMIQDGEVQVGAFGGSMIRGMTRELGIADTTIQALAAADFGKTKALTNHFDRPEVRVLAKMLVIRSILGEKGKLKPKGGVLGDDIGEDPGEL